MPNYIAVVQELLIQDSVVGIEANSPEEAEDLILRGEWDNYESSDIEWNCVMSPPKGGSLNVTLRVIKDGIPTWKQYTLETVKPLQVDEE